MVAPCLMCKIEGLETRPGKKYIVSHQMHLANSIRHQATFFLNVDVVVLHVDVHVKSSEIIVFLKKMLK